MGISTILSTRRPPFQYFKKRDRRCRTIYGVEIEHVFTPTTIYHAGSLFGLEVGAGGDDEIIIAG